MREDLPPLTLLAVTLAGLAKLLDLLDFNDIDPAIGWTMLSGILTLGLCVARSSAAGPATVVFGLLIGIRERLVATPFQGSDVLLATNEAIRVMVSGGNPYTHYYRDTIPAGSPFPYPIGEPFFYWIHQTLFGRIDYADLWSGILILLLFAALAPVIGWVRSAVAIMAYGLSSETVLNAAGGSNDTSLALFLVLGLTFLVYSLSRRTTPRWRLPLLIISAAFFGWALLFKLFALIVLPFVILALRQRHERWLLFSVVSFGIAGFAMLPYLIDDAAGVIDYVSRGGVHDEIWGFNIWTLLRPDAPGFVAAIEPRISSIQYIATAVIGFVLILRRRTDPGRAVLAGMLTCLTLIFLANWTTSAYYVGFLPVVVISAVIVGSPALALSPRQRAASQPEVLPLTGWLARRLREDNVLPDPNLTRTGPQSITVRPRMPSARHRRPVASRIVRWQEARYGATEERLSGMSLGFGDPGRTTGDPHPGTVTLLDLPKLSRQWLDAAVIAVTVGWQRLAANPLPLVAVIMAMVIGAALRLANIATNPPGIHQDEAVAGYDAWSLWLTLRDHHGNPLPWVGLETFGDWASPLLSFYLAPIVGLFGPDITVIRTGTAILGIAAIPLVFLAARELVGRSSTAIVAAWLVAISPWAVHLSRYAIPPATVSPLFALTLWLTLRALRKRTPASLVIAATAASLLISGYPTMKLYVPLMAGVFLLVYLRVWLVFPLRGLLWGAATLLLLVGPTYLFTFRSEAVQSRSRYLSLGSWTEVTPASLARQYWSYISPSFIFGRGDGDPTHIQPGFGLELRWLSIFMVVGIIVTIWRAIQPNVPIAFRRPAILLLLAIVLSPIPGAITYFQNSSRVAQLSVLFAVLTAIGIVGLFDICRYLLRAPHPAWTFRLASISMATLILVPLGVQARNRYHDYYVDYPRTYAVQWGFHSGIEDALRYVRTIQDDYAEIYVTDVSQGYMLVLFVDQVDPNSTVFDLRPSVYDAGTYRVEELGPYRVTDGRSGPPEEFDINSLPVLHESFMYGDGFGYVVRATTNAAGQPILIIQSMPR